MSLLARTSVLLGLGAISSIGCNVYDPNLLHRDGAIDGSDGVVIGDGAHDATPDGRTDGGLDVAHDAPLMDANDLVTDAADVADADVADVVTDAGPSCTALLAADASCLEPFAGQNFNPDDPRLIAPVGVAISPDLVPRIVVGDRASGRVMSYGTDGSSPRRIAGTGVVGIASMLGAGTSTMLGDVTSLTYLPSGDLLIADAQAHGIEALFRATSMIGAFGGTPYAFGPYYIQSLVADSSGTDPRTLLVSADNQIYAVSLSGGSPSAPSPIIGMPCGTTCTGFNSIPAAGTATQLNGPNGIDSDANFVYFADAQNCRIRRAARTGTPAYLTTVLAGGGGANNGCDTSGSIYGASGLTSVLATSAHLGVVGDVKVAADGTVYFTDLSHCAICAVNAAGMLSVVVGSSVHCGDTSTTTNVRATLGALGSLALSGDRTVLYFADREGQRVGALALGAGGPNGNPTFSVAPGVIPAMADTVDTVRAGGVTGLATTGTTAAPTVYWAGSVEGRVYEYSASAVTVFAGAGNERLDIAIPAARLEPSPVRGLATPDGTPDGGASTNTLALALETHHLVATAQSTALFPIAGTYDTSGIAAASTPAGTNLLDHPAWPLLHGNDLFFDSYGGSSPQVFRVQGAVATATLVPVAGSAPGVDGGGPPATDAGTLALGTALGRIAGLTFDGANNLYIADESNHVIWRVSAGNIQIVAGIFGQISPLDDTENDARGVAVPDPVALAFDGAHSIYIADAFPLQRIRRLDLSTNRIVTVAGAGSTTGDYIDALHAHIGQPASIAWLVDRLYFGEADTGRVRVLRVPH